MTDLDHYQVPDDLDVAAMLAHFLLEDVPYVDDTGQWTDEMREAAMANPLIAMVTMKELQAELVLHSIACILSGFAVRAGAQVTELCVAHQARGDEKLKDITARMSELDQRRMALLDYACSMASPFRLGPPDSVMPQLVDYMEIGS